MDYNNLLQGLGTAGGSLYNMYGPKQPNPADAANKYFSQIPGVTSQYTTPYMQAGQGALGQLTNQYSDLLGGKKYGELASGYQQSPGYAFKLQQAMQGANNAAAAGGMLGTPQSQEEAARISGQLSSEDFENYLNHQLDLYGKGLSGTEGINTMGYNAGMNQAGTEANVLGQQGQLAYLNQLAQNQANAKNKQGLFGGIGQALGGVDWGQMGQYGGDILKYLGLFA